MSLINWKYWLAFIVIVVAACVGGYLFGNTQGDASGYLRGHKELEDFQGKQADKNIAAVNDARKAQRDEDLSEIAAAKANAQVQSEAAAKAAGAKAAADAKASSLTKQLSELRKNDTAVAAQANTCLPAPILASLHGSEAPGVRCTPASGGH